MSALWRSDLFARNQMGPEYLTAAFGLQTNAR